VRTRKAYLLFTWISSPHYRFKLFGAFRSSFFRQKIIIKHQLKWFVSHYADYMSCYSVASVSKQICNIVLRTETFLPGRFYLKREPNRNGFQKTTESFFRNFTSGSTFLFVFFDLFIICRKPRTISFYWIYRNCYHSTYIALR